jgi:hypothetical protein
MSRKEAAALAGMAKIPADSERLAEYWALAMGVPEEPSECLVDPRKVVRVVEGILYDANEATRDRLAAAKLLMQHAGLLTPQNDPEAAQGGQITYNIQIVGSRAEITEDGIRTAPDPAASLPENPL